MRFLSGLMILLLGFYGVSAFGEEIPAGQPPVPDNVPPANGGHPRPIMATSTDPTPIFDRKINQVVTWFDGLFADKARPDTEKSDIKLRWSNELRAEEGESFKYRSSLHAHLHLPRSKRGSGW